MEGFDLKNFGVIGPANGCTDGFRLIRVQISTIDNVVMRLGATLYAMRMQGCIGNRIRFFSGQTIWSHSDWSLVATVMQANV